MRIQLQGVLIGVSFSLLSGSGCSLIGYGVGSAVDSSRQDTTWISGWSNWELQESDSIAISVKGESVVQGLFLRWSQLPDSVYEQRYATGSSSGTFSLPRIHDTVRVRIRPGVRKEQIYVGRFLGFTVDPYSLRSMIKLSHDNRTLWLTLKDVDSVATSDAMTLSGSVLDNLVISEDVQVNYGMTVSVAESDTLVAVNDIAAIQVVRESRLRWTGLILGGVIDAGTLIWLATSDIGPQKGLLSGVKFP